MAASNVMAFPLPPVPVKHNTFVQYVQAHPETPMRDLVRPYNDYDAAARKIFAQDPSHSLVKDNHANIAPLYDATGSTDIRVRARDLAAETPDQKKKYILPLEDAKRLPNGSPAVVSTLAEFQNNFTLFTEGALSDLDWSNVVAAGSAVVTSLLPVPEKYRKSKRDLRQYYHEEFAPASDVDLFLYGLTEEQAIEKIKHIEDKIRNTILYETTTIRTKNTITIASQFPTRHVQIVLRIYHSIAEILTGFDVDCSCAAYDGKQVYAAPRAIASYITQTNQIDLTRRSPSYENRLSKYSHRGFEVFWPQLDRSKIDPTIFERSFTRTEGLARLLVLEQLPKAEDRDSYLQKRREERGRPPLSVYLLRRQGRELHGNIKDNWEDEVPEWQEKDQVSDYHTFTIPYGRRFNARKIEKLLYTKDLLLNAQWNQPKDRTVYLHRHPAFFGEAEHAMSDCCGYCPQPVTDEERKVEEEEGKIYISGNVSFIKDDPGRQEIGSFNPITETDWTEMAYIGRTELLCQAIVSDDLKGVQEFLAPEDSNPDRRDYTGRTPLQLACTSSTPEIVQCLVDHGARLIARMADGKTALHLAAARGHTEIVRILLKKSNENEEAENEKSTPVDTVQQPGTSDQENNADYLSQTSASYVKIDKEGSEEVAPTHDTIDENELEPDIYDINVASWDSLTSPLHLAILHGHVETVKELVTSFGADVLMPIKITHEGSNSARAAILTLAMALFLPLEKAKEMSRTLLELGASPAQADVAHCTPLHYVAQSKYAELFDIYLGQDRPGVERAINHISSVGLLATSSPVCTAFMNALSAKNATAARKLLEMGAKPTIDRDGFFKLVKAQASSEWHYDILVQSVKGGPIQPVMHAVNNDLPLVALDLLHRGADVNSGYQKRYDSGQTVLDCVRHALQQLRDFFKQPQVVYSQPITFEKDYDSYLADFQEGFYQMFTANTQLNKAKRINETAEKNKPRPEAVSEEPGLPEKKKTLTELIDQYEVLEKELLSRNAKTYEELHPPELQAPVQKWEPQIQDSNRKKLFEVTFFKDSPLSVSESLHEAYIQLFEAAWKGDIETIKRLTLGNWGAANDKPPLDLATSDDANLTCFSIAVLRGHLQLAEAILQILRVQYKGMERQDRQRFEINSEDDSSDDGLNIVGHDVNDQFTHENIGEAVTQVQGTLSPRRALILTCPVSLFLEEDTLAREFRDVPLDSRYYSTILINNLLKYAIFKNNLTLLDWLLKTGDEWAKTDPYDKSAFTCSQEEFQLAMILGHTECLGMLIQRTAVGLPLMKMSEESGVEDRDEHQYYLGLSIRGKKRKDWADAGRPDSNDQYESAARPPLLISAMHGSLSSTEWFLSKAPSRLYLEYVNAHLEDKNVRKLVKSKLGLEASVLKWLQTRNNLVLHCAVMSKPCDESEQLVQYLVDHHPECLEARSSNGRTPLALAFSLHRLSFARILIKAGANQTTRDSQGRNLLHLLLLPTQEHSCESSEPLFQMLALFDQDLVTTMLTQRAGHNSQTPFAYWLGGYPDFDVWNDILSERINDLSVHIKATASITKLFLDLGKSTNQKFLELFDGSGNTPVHAIVKKSFPQVLGPILDSRPDLLYRENATGSTPLELAEDSWVNATTRNPLSIAVNNYDRQNARWGNAVDRAAQSWVDKRDGRSSEELMYQFCQSRAVQRGQKRKLVGILDANAVAIRLASKKQACDDGDIRRYGRYGQTFDHLDEVELWASLATSWPGLKCACP